MPIDVVIVTYQSERHLPGCLTSLQRDANVIVVDNASNDRSADLAAVLGAQVVVRNPENRGFAAAANQAARLGRGELILFLNPDATLAAEDLDRLVSTLDADPGLFAVGARLRHPDGTEQRAWWPFPSPVATWKEALGLHLVWPSSSDHPRPGFVVGACMLVRRHVFEALDGFDERFWLYGEEADLCRRAWGRGWRVRLAAEATAEHLGGASGEQVRGLAFEHFQRGVEHFMLKHHGHAALVAHRVGLLVGSVLRLPLLAGQPWSSATDRLHHRRAVARRLARVLVRHPARVTP